jgi:ornithine cyclodeaminase/alanine dehydrogenase-like protein (mu-crystallin family)
VPRSVWIRSDRSFSSKGALIGLDPLVAIEEGFVAYSQGKTEIPPVGELIFADPPGDMHIKYGCIKGDDDYVIKIASGFYENYRCVSCWMRATSPISGLQLRERLPLNI